MANEIDKIPVWHAMDSMGETKDGRTVYTIMTMDPSNNTKHRVILVDVREYEELADLMEQINSGEALLI